MRDNALYFPFIAVPRGTWLLKTLLYWDRLFSIVPHDHSFERSDDGSFTRELIQRKLVEPVFPREHLYQLPDYEASFIEYIQRKSPRLKDLAGELFVAPAPWVPLHAEKLQGLGEELVRRELGRRLDHDWYEVEPWVAAHLMTYLAALLGGLESVNAAPITDDRRCFSLLGGTFPRFAVSDSRLWARMAILQEILPLPSGPLNLDSVAQFKAAQGSRLGDFRREIERRCIAIAQTDPADRNDMLELTIRDLRGERDAIKKAMEGHWKEVFLGPILSVVGAGVAAVLKPLIDPISGTVGITGSALSLVHTVYRAAKTHQDYRSTLAKPLAYAAFAQRQFGGVTTP